MSWQLNTTRRVEGLEDARLYQCRLDPPAPLDEPKVIAELAPLLLDPGSALTVTEQEERLVDVSVALARLLRSAVSLGHGGALAFLPDVPGAPVRLTHPLEPIDFGEALLDAWGAECAVWAAYRRDVESVLRAAESKRVCVQRWLRLMKTAARFTAADGCVVFDNSLRLHGFGGKIKIEKPSGIPPRRCVDLRHDRETSREEVLRLHGTRHGSAFDLCEAMAGVVMFVISQDGDLRLFASSDDTVYYAAGLRP